MIEQTSQKARNIVQNNLAYLDEVVEATIVNLLEDEGIVEGDKEFVWELQYIYDIYVARKKYGRQLT